MAERDEITVTVVDPDGRRTDLTVTAGRSALVAEVLAPLLSAAGCSPGPVWVAGRLLVPTDSWASCGVRHGSVLCPAPLRSVRGGGLELRVVAGPAAGGLHVLGNGASVVGRALDCDLVLGDDEVSRHHLQVEVTEGTVVVRDLASTNGAAVDGVLVGVEGLSLVPGALLTLGESQLSLVPTRTDAAALDPASGPILRFHRPPRVAIGSSALVQLPMPAPPPDAERGRVPWAALAVPLALGAVMVAVMPSSPQFLLLMAMSPLMMLGNLAHDRWGGRRGRRSAGRAYELDLVRARQALSSAQHEDERTRRVEAPDPAELAGRAVLPSSRLWERRGRDGDALCLRLGVADLPARVVPLATPAVDDGNAAAPARSVPVVLSLDETGVLGVVGSAGPGAALTRWLVGQAAVLLSPSDLAVVVLTSAADAWEWLRWLPHARGGDDECQVMVGLDPIGWAARVGEVSRRLGHGGRVLLVLDGTRELRGVAGLAGLLAEGPALGLRVVCRDTEERSLPQECSAVATFEAGSHTRLRLRAADGAVVHDVLADQVSPSWAETVARGLAGLDDCPEDAGGTAALPDAVRLLDLVDLAQPSAGAVAARWRASPAGTTAVVGVGVDGPLQLDLRADGPHALVAGTTGAGKSELLQTLVASLALANRPDALTFVLVDYKGGAAFRDCARLPHTVGLVTDLDGRLTERALASLSAELRRREQVLAEHGVKDLESLLAAATGAPPLPRLVIVIDEFATLVEELPDFVRGIVGIAQRGRSLGLHLVLATQRPGGVVSPDIRANTNLRICLRVTQANESSDVVDSPDAAAIPATAGRAVVRTGSGSLRSFQTARIGGRAAPVRAVDAGPTVTEVPFAALSRRRPPAPASEEAALGPSDLTLVVDAMRGAAEAMGLGEQRRPWLDPLPTIVVLDAVPPVADDELPLGLLDLPAEQRQVTHVLRLADPGHLLVVGTPRSGRSTVLQTMAGTVASGWSADDLHVYALDFGNQALASLAALPHCGAVVGRDEAARLDRLLSRLSAEVARRHEQLAVGGYADVAEQRRLAPSAERLPWLLLLLDRWEGFLATHQDVELGRRVDDLLRLLREGPAAGLTAVVTADRSGLLGRLPAVVQDRLVLRLADRGDYGLADVPARTVPVSPPPGRALVLGNGETRMFHDVQIALLSADPAGPAQAAALRGRVAAARARHDGRPLRHPPIRVDPLPATVTLDDVLRLGPTAAEAAGLWALIGVGGDTLAPVGVDLRQDGPGFLVVGGARSGRSTALTTMAESLLRSGRQVCLVVPRRSPLSALAGRPGVTGLLDATASLDGARRVLRAGGQAPVVLVDDAEWLTDTPVGAVLEEELRAEVGDGACVVAAGNSEDLQSIYRGFTLSLRRSRCGLLLNPQSSLDGDLVGARLPRQVTPGRQAGRALLALRGDLTPVQVAQA